MKVLIHRCGVNSDLVAPVALNFCAEGEVRVVGRLLEGNNRGGGMDSDLMASVTLAELLSYEGVVRVIVPGGACDTR